MIRSEYGIWFSTDLNARLINIRAGKEKATGL